ncbi:hypothetical protein Tco_0464884 [Tanacetum coccineum]
MSMTIQSSVKDKILATSSETSKVENAPAEMLRDLDQQMEKRADDGKANVVTDALSRKERVKPRRVRAMAMIIISMESENDIGNRQSRQIKKNSVSSGKMRTVWSIDWQSSSFSSIQEIIQDDEVGKDYLDEIIARNGNSGDDQHRF